MTRILFLHGFAQNPQEIRCKTRQIQQALGNCHFVFPAAAVQLVSYDGDIEDRARADQVCSKRYAWNTSSADMSSHLINMTILLQHLGPILEKQGPFDGIMGFSQGAAVACATTSVLEKGLSNVRHPPFQFCVSFCGARPAAEEFDSIFSNIRTPSLHIIAKQDVMVPLDRSLTLVQAFSNSSVVYHPGHRTSLRRKGIWTLPGKLIRNVERFHEKFILVVDASVLSEYCASVESDHNKHANMTLADFGALIRILSFCSRVNLYGLNSQPLPRNFCIFHAILLSGRYSVAAIQRSLSFYVVASSRRMSQAYLKSVLNSLNDEANLAQTASILRPTLLNITNVGNDEASLAKLHARLSALLQSKDSGLRWSGVYLVRACLERREGKWESLMSHGSTWMKLLLKILERESHEHIIECTVATISYIIKLTDGKPSLTRDLTTPSLPTFFKHIFDSIDKNQVSPGLMKKILQDIQEILREHPTTFRPSAARLETLTTGLINGSCKDETLVELAAECFTSLHMCAPKNTASERWRSMFCAVIGESHACLSYLLQIVVEDAPILTVHAGMNMLPFSSEYVSQIAMAISRLKALLQTVAAFLRLPTKSNVKVPIGQLVMLIQRILTITPRSGIKASTPQASQVALISILPQLHHLAYGLVSTSVNVLGNHLLPHCHALQDFAIEDGLSSHEQCSNAAIQFFTLTLEIFGYSAEEPQQFTKLISRALKTVRAIVPSATSMTGKEATASQGQRKRKHGGTNEGSDRISHDLAFHQFPAEETLRTMVKFLGAAITHTYGLITKGTRQQIDTIVLRILAINTYSLEPYVIIELLELLSDSIFAPEPSPLAASVLSAGIKTIKSLSGHRDINVHKSAMTIMRQLDLLIHPRFPALRRRRNIQEDEEEQKAVQVESSDDDADDVEMVVSETIETQNEAVEMPEPLKPNFELPNKGTVTRSDQPPEPTIVDHSVLVLPVERPEEKEAQIDGDVVPDDDDSEDMPEICMDSDTEEE